MNKKHTLKDWIIATRPWSFPASSMPVAVTLAYLFWLGYYVNWAVGLWTLVTVILFHAAGNTWSDYSDFKRGVDREDTIGGVSLTSGEFMPKEIKTLSMGLLLVAVVSGTALMVCTGLPTLYLGLAGVALTMMYPFFKYHALGDVDIFLTYSLLPVLGTSYVATGAFIVDTLWLVLPIGLITVGILHINNTRDIEHDKRAGIYTFAMLVGKSASAVIYCVELLFPFVWVAGCVVYGHMPLWSLLVFVAFKPALDNSRKALAFPKEGMKAVGGVDEATAKLQLMFSMLLVVSFFMREVNIHFISSLL